MVLDSLLCYRSKAIRAYAFFLLRGTTLDVTSDSAFELIDRLTTYMNNGDISITIFLD